MAKIRFHKVAALVVLAATAAWVATGEFTSVGSAASEDASPAPTTEAKAPQTPRTVGVVTPPRLDHARAIRISGYTDADKRAVVGTRAAGVIAELPISLGSQVKRGDVIAKLEAEGKEAAVETARQLLSQREAEANASRRLAQGGSLPRLQLDNVISALAAARSQLETAEAELDRNTVRAPFDGVVDKVNVELGSAVQQGTEVATLLNLDPVLAKGEVSERELGYIKPGDRAQVRLVSGQEVDGTIRHVSRDANSATRTFRVEVAIPNEDHSVPAGMTAEITLRAASVPATILPRSVVTLSNQGDLGIRAVGADNKVAFFPIDLVDDTPQGLILGGIPKDVRVIVAGQEMISDGDTVNPVEADSETIKTLVGEVTGSTQ